MLTDKELMLRVGTEDVEELLHRNGDKVGLTLWTLSTFDHDAGVQTYYYVIADTSTEAEAIAEEYITRIEGEQIFDEDNPDGAVEILDGNTEKV